MLNAALGGAGAREGHEGEDGERIASTHARAQETECNASSRVDCVANVGPSGSSGSQRAVGPTSPQSCV